MVNMTAIKDHYDSCHHAHEKADPFGVSPYKHNVICL